MIRRIRVADTELARELRLRALKSDPQSFGSSYEIEVVRDAAFWAESTRRHAESDDCAIFIAFRENQPVGLVRGGRDADRQGIFFVHAMWVAPEARRQGIAAALLRTVEEWIATKGGTACELMVTDAALDARRLYERAGYVADGYQEPSRHAGVKEHRMRKNLSER